METLVEARQRAAEAASKATDLTAELDDDGRSDQEDDPNAQARGLEALAAAAEAADAFDRANRAAYNQTEFAIAQADRAERALARVAERMGSESQTKMRTMRLVIGVTVVDTDVELGSEGEFAMMNRVITAILPHPDDAVRTGHGSERATVMMTDWKVTS